MKKLLSVLAVCAILFSSCKKNNTTNSDYYVKGDVNGQEVNYTGFTSAVFTTLPGSPSYNILAIQGMQSQGAVTNLFGIVITDQVAITTKTYTDATVGNTVQGVVNYYNGTNVQFTSALSVNPGVTITITEITNSYVSGTFSGAVESTSSNESAIITNGSFRAKRQ